MANVTNELNPSIKKYLANIDFPVNKDDIVEQAIDNDAPDEVLEVLNRLEDKSYNSFYEIAEKASKVN